MKINPDKAFFAAINGVVVVGTVAFMAFYPDPLSLMIILSGWTSFGAIALADYLAVKAFRLKQEVDEKEILKRLDQALREVETVANHPLVADAVANWVRTYAGGKPQDKPGA